MVRDDNGNVAKNYEFFYGPDGSLEEFMGIAHRGGDGAATFEYTNENRPEAFQAAVAAGIRYCEVDVASTADGKAILYHGNYRSRGVVERTDYVDLSATGLFPHGVPVLLEEILYDFPDLKFFFDLKTDGAVRPTAQAIIRAGAAARVSPDGHLWRRAQGVANLVNDPRMPVTNGVYGAFAVAAFMLEVPYAKHFRARHIDDPACFSLPDAPRVIPRNLPDNIRKPMEKLYRLALARVALEAQNMGNFVLVHNPNTLEDIEWARQNGMNGVFSDRIALLQKMQQ